jgi:hypothetical protein
MSESDLILAGEIVVWLVLAWLLVHSYQHRMRSWKGFLMLPAAILLLLTSFFILSELAIDRFYREMRSRRIQSVPVNIEERG